MAIPFNIPNQQQFMPTAAPVAAPMEHPNAGGDIESLRARLYDYVESILDEEEPEAPQMSAPRALRPWEAAAAALNPQHAQAFTGRAQQEATASNATAQQAFEAQMGRRDKALGMAGTMLGQDAKMTRAGRPVVRENTLVGQDGKRYRVREVVDPFTGDVLDQNVLGEAPESLAMLPSAEGYFPTSRQTGEARGGPVQQQGGGTIYPPPPAGTVTNVARSTATLQGIDEMEEAYGAIRQHISSKDQSLAGQYVGGIVGGSEYGGPLSPEYSKYYTRMNAALNNYVLAITGQQFSDSALTRYSGQFPKPWDPEDVAAEKIASVKQRAVSDMRSQINVFPGAGGAAPSSRPSMPTGGRTISRELFNMMSPRGQQVFMSSGGTVTD